MTLQHRPRPILGAAVGPRRQEWALVCAMNAPAGEVSEFRQFLLAGQAKLKPRRADPEAVLGPQFDKHGPDLDGQEAAKLLVYRVT